MEGKKGKLFSHTARNPGTRDGLGSAQTYCCSSAEPPAVARTEGGDRGSAGHSYYQNSKDGTKDGHKMNCHIVELPELWKTPQIQTIDVPQSITDASFLKHPDLATCQERYLCGITKVWNVNYLRVLMKRQYMHMIQRNSQKPGVLTHHRSRLGSRPLRRQPHPCTAWRHQLDREDSGPSNTAAAPAPAKQHSLWRPLRNKGGLKTGYVSKTRYKSLKIFRKTGRLFMKSVSTNDFESYMNEDKKEESLSKCMQSMSIEEQGEHRMSP
ncbi:family with sequence similarity 216 member A [Phyllostomus discolor]|uniref:Family with sequence similarity 216 member A n=1 Tax=Phyllostomus discolor TaxID=89673 RepID=A0A833YV25_9CHIR|nr:family with sequence similarity 216 member A [Phyllostomus discolor]